MAPWTPDELQLFATTEEVEVSSHRADGSLRPYVIIWAVVVAGQVYVRSAYGAQNGWYRRAEASGTGSIRSGALERDVRYVAADPGVQTAIDAEYRRKYGHFPADILGTVVGEGVHTVTLRVDAA